MVKENVEKFYIRAQKCDALTQEIKKQTAWKTVEINFKKVEICSINYKPFNQEITYRYVVSREANKTGQIDVFQEDNFTYSAIITEEHRKIFLMS